MIYQGRQLDFSEKLSKYNIKDEHFIHLVSKIAERPDNNNPIGSNDNNLGRRSLSEDIVGSIVEIPIIRSRRNRRRVVENFDISESFEVMHQNLFTINNMERCMEKFNEAKIVQTNTVVPFNFERQKYEVGQWLDVKDTIDQWLDSQVININNNNQAYVHYNGWGVRWDEWIDFNSPRMAPLK